VSRIGPISSEHLASISLEPPECYKPKRPDQSVAGKFAVALSWNDGYYSDRYSWLSGSLAYTQAPHSLVLVGMDNLGHTAYQTLATPVQNKSLIYELRYTYAKETGSFSLTTSTPTCPHS